MTRAPDPAEVRAPGDHGTYEDAVVFALEVYDDTLQTYEFLKAWSEGSLDDWPEYYEWLDGRATEAPPVAGMGEACQTCKGRGGVTEEQDAGVYVGAECPFCHGHGFSEDVEDEVWSAIMEAQGPDSNARDYARAALLVVARRNSATLTKSTPTEVAGGSVVKDREKLARTIAAGIWGQEASDLYFDPRYDAAPDIRRGRAYHTADLIAALTKPTPPACVSGDVVVVPREPTEAMIEAGADAWTPGIAGHGIRTAWDAMLAAAPEAATPSAVGGVDRMREALEEIAQFSGPFPDIARAALASGETSPDRGAPWQPIETARKGARVEGLRCDGKGIVKGRIPPRDGKVRETNVVISDEDGRRYVCTHWRAALNEQPRTSESGHAQPR